MERHVSPAATLDPRRCPDGGSEAGDAFSKTLLAALVSLRDADFSARMPRDLTGLDGKIADTFKDIATLADRRAGETARVSRAVGKEGRLRSILILRSKIGVFVDAFRKTQALAELNGALQREIGERERAQEALQLANHDLERRVQERTAALTRAHQGVRENEERLRMALDVAQIAAWEWHLGVRPSNA